MNTIFLYMKHKLILVTQLGHLEAIIKPGGAEEHERDIHKVSPEGNCIYK